MVILAYAAPQLAASQLLTISSGVAVQPPIDREGFLAAADFVHQPDTPARIAEAMGISGDSYEHHVQGFKEFSRGWVDAHDVPTPLRKALKMEKYTLLHIALSCLGMYLLTNATEDRVFLDPDLFYGSGLYSPYARDSAFMMEETVAALLRPIVAGQTPRVLLFGPGNDVHDVHYARRFLDRLSSVAGSPAHLDVFEGSDIFGINCRRKSREIDWGRHTYSFYIGQK